MRDGPTSSHKGSQNATNDPVIDEPIKTPKAQSRPAAGSQGNPYVWEEDGYTYSTSARRIQLGPEQSTAALEPEQLAVEKSAGKDLQASAKSANVD